MKNQSKSMRFCESVKKANEILEHYSIDAPPVPIEEIVENYGLQLQFVDLKEKSGEISGLYDSDSKTIYVNSKDTPARQRFTIAHEFGHALLHKRQLETDPNMGIFYRRSLQDKIFDRLEEQEANCFAAHLLVPESIIRNIYQNCKSIEILSKIFNVSQQVINFHIRNLGLK